jgi:hypothetical protein
MKQVLARLERREQRHESLTYQSPTGCRFFGRVGPRANATLFTLAIRHTSYIDRGDTQVRRASQNWPGPLLAESIGQASGPATKATFSRSRDDDKGRSLIFTIEVRFHRRVRHAFVRRMVTRRNCTIRQRSRNLRSGLRWNRPRARVPLSQGWKPMGRCFKQEAHRPPSDALAPMDRASLDRKRKAAFAQPWRTRADDHGLPGQGPRQVRQIKVGNKVRFEAEQASSDYTDTKMQK